MTIESITPTGANASSFAFTNNCGSSLASGASCIIQGQFEPTASGSQAAALTVTDNATDSPQLITLTGTGLTPATASLSVSSLTFGSQVIGVASASQRFLYPIRGERHYRSPALA